MMDINCDLGEGEPRAKTRALMRLVTSANIACGGHAGDVASMRACLRLAEELGVRAGAHPGLWDRENFGRVEGSLKVGEFKTLLARQAGVLALYAWREGVKLTHIKLHGALYHMAEKRPALAKAYVGFVRECLPALEIYGLPGGLVEREARKKRQAFRGEVYADRAYDGGGKLVSRTMAGAVLKDLDVIETRMKTWAKTGMMMASDGKKVRITGGTICVHSDSPNAVGVAKRLRQSLSQHAFMPPP